MDQAMKIHKPPPDAKSKCRSIVGQSGFTKLAKKSTRKCAANNNANAKRATVLSENFDFAVGSIESGVLMGRDPWFEA